MIESFDFELAADIPSMKAMKSFLNGIGQQEGIVLYIFFSFSCKFPLI